MILVCTGLNLGLNPCMITLVRKSPHAGRTPAASPAPSRTAGPAAPRSSGAAGPASFTIGLAAGGPDAGTTLRSALNFSGTAGGGCYGARLVRGLVLVAAQQVGGPEQVGVDAQLAGRSRE